MHRASERRTREGLWPRELQPDARMHTTQQQSPSPTYGELVERINRIDRAIDAIWRRFAADLRCVRPRPANPERAVRELLAVVDRYAYDVESGINELRALMHRHPSAWKESEPGRRHMDPEERASRMIDDALAISRAVWSERARDRPFGRRRE